MKTQRVSLSLVACLSFYVGACGGNKAEHRQKIINQELSRLPPPSRPLTEFSSFELTVVQPSDEVAADERKVKVVEQLNSRLQTRLTPLLTTWMGKGVRVGNWSFSRVSRNCG